MHKVSIGLFEVLNKAEFNHVRKRLKEKLNFNETQVMFDIRVVEGLIGTQNKEELSKIPWIEYVEDVEDE